MPREDRPDKGATAQEIYGGGGGPMLDSGRCTYFAVDGTPVLDTTNSMYQPGCAMAPCSGLSSNRAMARWARDDTQARSIITAHG